MANKLEIEKIYNEIYHLHYTTTLDQSIKKAKLEIKQLYPHTYTAYKIVKHIELMEFSIKDNIVQIEEATAEFNEDMEIYKQDLRLARNNPSWCETVNGELKRSPTLPILEDYTSDYNWDNLIINEYNLEISTFYKKKVSGFMICISPKADSIDYKELLKLTAKLGSCPHVKRAVYYIEFYTDGSPNGNKPHIHLYGIPNDTSSKTINKIRSYTVAIFKKVNPNIICSKKHDITYGEAYISAIASTHAKQELKRRDKEKN